jgi:hypothetical protein
MTGSRCWRRDRLAPGRHWSLAATVDGQEAAQHEQDAAGPGITGGPADECGTEGRLVTRTRERYAAICQPLAAGESLHAINRSLSLSRSPRGASPVVRLWAWTRLSS